VGSVESRLAGLPVNLPIVAVCFIDHSLINTDKSRIIADVDYLTLKMEALRTLVAPVTNCLS